jgi:phosphoserine phosphatase
MFKPRLRPRLFLIQRSLMADTAMENAEKTGIPLCVDLDGTLIRTDLLIESALAVLAQHPLAIFSMLVWLVRGKAHLKREIARRVVLNPSSLPYNHELIDWLNEQRAHRSVVLCTASDVTLARPVANHAGVFDDVIASDGETNLSG